MIPDKSVARFNTFFIHSSCVDVYLAKEKTSVGYELYEEKSDDSRERFFTELEEL